MSDTKFKIAIFASGSGSNAEEIMKRFSHHTSIEVVVLLSNNPEAYALQRAKKFGVEAIVFNRTQFRETTEVLQVLKERGVTHVVLAGFLWLVPAYLIQAYPNEIVNIHPALLPNYGGKGMYGTKVHEAVRAAGDKESGITIHLVNEKYDEGEILAQAKCTISPTDSPTEIATKVHALEYAHYPEVIEKWILK